MREKHACCPNCDTVLTLQYNPADAEGMWYECAICGYRVLAKDFRSLEAMDSAAHRGPRAA